MTEQHKPRIFMAKGFYMLSSIPHDPSYDETELWNRAGAFCAVLNHKKRVDRRRQHYTGPERRQR